MDGILRAKRCVDDGGHEVATREVHKCDSVQDLLHQVTINHLGSSPSGAMEFVVEQPGGDDIARLLALRILGGGEGVKSAGDQEHAEPVVVVVGEAAGDPAGEFDEPVHGLGAAVG